MSPKRTSPKSDTLWYSLVGELLRWRKPRSRRSQLKSGSSRRSGNKQRRTQKLASDPELAEIWSALIELYFPERRDLLRYTVIWSKRNQIRTLASCNIDSCRVRVARELNFPEHTEWLSPLLYHEMCHAVLGTSIRQPGEKTRWHGPEFRKLERRHPAIPAFDRWVKGGGWTKAVRSHRAKQAHQRRKLATNSK
ncbi:SprT-like domain-containing protein [bacterium]|nr:SprT-like domain-containing protein [bacterium]